MTYELEQGEIMEACLQYVTRKHQLKSGVTVDVELSVNKKFLGPSVFTARVVVDESEVGE